jgi:hypothetical protein
MPRIENRYLAVGRTMRERLAHALKRRDFFDFLHCLSKSYFALIEHRAEVAFRLKFRTEAGDRFC